MGIRGLRKLCRNRGGWESRRISGPLVVDANQLCHQIGYTFTDRLRLGEEINYAEYYEFVVKVITKLKRCGIVPYFIFDGVDKGDKLTTERRKKSASGGIPTLLYTVFCNVLREMDANSFVGDGEGDITCSQVAHFLNCPVFSCDSDFYLFNLPRGYIDIKDCLENRVFDDNSDTFKVEVYDRERFIRNHYAKDLDHIFLFPAILGNGMVPETGHLLDRRRPWNVHEVDNRRINIDRLPDGVRRNFEAVKAYYNDVVCRDPAEILSSPIPRCTRPVPGWFRDAHRTRAIPYMLYDALVNRKQHHGSSPLSTSIRQCCYAIIGVREVTEYHCRVGRVDECTVPCISGPQPQIVLDQIDAGDTERKRSMFYFAMRCEGKAVQLNDLSDGDRFIAATIIFWKDESNPRPPDALIKALVACFVRLNSIRERKEVIQVCRRFQHQPPSNQAGVNQLIDWQRVYQDALVLFPLLRYPPESVPCLSHVFNQSAILTLASNGPGVIDGAIETFLGDRGLQEKYDNLIQIILYT